jgi:hypothetical protein
MVFGISIGVDIVTVISKGQMLVGRWLEPVVLVSCPGRGFSIARRSFLVGYVWIESVLVGSGIPVV